MQRWVDESEKGLVAKCQELCMASLRNSAPSVAAEVYNTALDSSSPCNWDDNMAEKGMP
jgi:hypothetical protein